MKKILLLGGSAQQVVAIKTAKRLGYYTVLCDYLSDNPGQFYADKFYLESTTEKQKILEIAESEKIDGILAYASDPAAPTAAYVAEKLGLPGNPYESVDILCNKDKFRSFLRENGFHSPEYMGYRTKESALADLGRFKLPVIVKPVDSSGSKGSTVLHDWEKVADAAEYAFSFSRAHRIIVEEYIEKKHPFLIGGDVFVENGKIVLWGLLNCHRDEKVNPLVPVGKSFPLQLDTEDVNAVKSTLQDLVDKLHLRSCAMNVELVVDKDGNVWPIDIGPRNGGNMIPDLLGMIYDMDVVEMSVYAAMGLPTACRPAAPRLYFATHNLHTDKTGLYEGVSFSDEIRQFVVREEIYRKSGDAVEYFDNAAKAIGIVFFHFDTLQRMKDLLGSIEKHVSVIVRTD